jgi:hypothetical protein
MYCRKLQVEMAYLPDIMFYSFVPWFKGVKLFKTLTSYMNSPAVLIM